MLRSARGLPSVIALRGLLAAAFFSAEVFIPLWLTSQSGWSIAEAGFALSSGALCWSAGSALQARIVERGRRLFWLRAGFLLLGAGIGSIGVLVLVGGNAYWLLPSWSLTGFGIGMAFPMLSVLTLQLSPIDQQGANSSALQLSDALTTACVLALNGAAFAWLHAAHPNWAFASVFGVAAALALLGAAMTGRCRSH